MIFLLFYFYLFIIFTHVTAKQEVSKLLINKHDDDDESTKLMFLVFSCT